MSAAFAVRVRLQDKTIASVHLSEAVFVWHLIGRSIMALNAVRAFSAAFYSTPDRSCGIIPRTAIIN